MLLDTMLTKRNIAIVPSVLLAFAAPFFARAAVLKIAANPISAEINQPVQVNLMLDTQGANANAIQGEIRFPAGLFTLRSVLDGSSPVSFWITAPHEIASGVVALLSL